VNLGRAALVTSFGIFKYMAVYSLTQFVSVIILYTIQSNLSDVQFLYIDLFLISFFALFFGHTEPYDGPLVKQPPSASLVSAAPIASILCHMASIVGIQVLAFVYVQQQPWFTPYVPVEDDFKSYENYALFTVSTFQYIIMAVVFSRGEPYRKSLLTNHSLLASLVIMTSFTTYLVLWPCSWLRNSFELLVPPSFEFRLTLIGFAFCNLIIAILIEYGVVNFIVAKKFGHKQANAKKAHVKIEKDLLARSDWPPLVSSPSLSNPHDERLVPGTGNERGNSLGSGGGSMRRATIDSSGQHVSKHCRRHSSALAIPIPKPDPFTHRRPRSQNSSTMTPSSEPNNMNSFLNGPLRNSHHDCRIALDILPNNCKS
jgi:hypothetical protein